MQIINSRSEIINRHRLINRRSFSESIQPPLISSGFLRKEPLMSSAPCGQRVNMFVTHGCIFALIKQWAGGSRWMLKTLARQKKRRAGPPPPQRPPTSPENSLGLAACSEGGSHRCFMDFNGDGAIALHWECGRLHFWIIKNIIFLPANFLC